MGDNQHGHAIVGKLAHDTQDLADQLGVESGGGLVEKHQLRIHRDSAGDRDALLLAAGKLRRISLGLGREADHVEQFHRALLRGLDGLALNLDWGLDDIFQRGAVGEEVEGLEHHADVRALLRGILGADFVQDAVFLAVADQFAVHIQAAGRNLLEVVHAAQQGGFAGAGRADEAGDVAGGHFKVDAFQHVQVAEGFPDLVGFDHRGGH